MIRRLSIVVALVAVLTSCTTTAQDQQAARRAEVAEKGRSVMPFDLEKTTHHFLEQQDGLRQEVVADDPDDMSQIELIREHLTAEAERFRTGDFDDPSRIHGDDMPGLAELSAGARRITIRYADLDNGAVLTFRTDDPTLVDALHAWGEAQVSDHGNHAG